MCVRIDNMNLLVNNGHSLSFIKKTNAEVLKWIKEWDPIVFPETAKMKKTNKLSTQEKPKNPLMLSFGAKSSQKTAKDEKNPSNKFNSKPSNNVTKGPDHRILLISGKC